MTMVPTSRSTINHLLLYVVERNARLGILDVAASVVHDQSNDSMAMDVDQVPTIIVILAYRL
jgi:hypothetical protein